MKKLAITHKLQESEISNHPAWTDKADNVCEISLNPG
jgi:hypothetical protein